MIIIHNKIIYLIIILYILMNFSSKFISGICSDTIISCKGPIYKNIKYVSKGDKIYTYKNNCLNINIVNGIDRYLVDMNNIIKIKYNFSPVKNNKPYISDFICTKYQIIYCNEDYEPIIADNLKLTDKPIDFNNIYFQYENISNDFQSSYKQSKKYSNPININILDISNININNIDYLEKFNNKIAMYNLQINDNGAYFSNFLMTNTNINL